MENNKKICFIGGSGRSGTSILKRVLNKHPKTYSLPIFEWRFLNDPDGIVDFYNTFQENWSPYWIDKKILRLNKLLVDLGKTSKKHRIVNRALRTITSKSNVPPFAYYPYSSINLSNYIPEYNQSAKELIEELNSFCYRGIWNGSEYLKNSKIHFGPHFKEDRLSAIFKRFITGLLDKIGDKSGKFEYFIEDDPFNFLFFDTIQKIYPNSKLIHIYRDPRDVIASMIKQRWAPSQLNNVLLWYKEIMKEWERKKSNLKQEDYLEVALEVLSHDPEKQLKFICEFLNLNWDDKMLSLSLAKTNEGRWKKDFSLEEQKQINTALKDELSKLSYPVE